MSSKRLSPAADLLRNSRLFSLPAPLPYQTVEVSRRNARSDSATITHPVQQAITTPLATLVRGDWGLKRALPGRAGRTSTPSIRINALDTIEHITDFDSAADMSVSLEKFQEMNLPITKVTKETSSPYSTNRPVLKSVFESSTDNVHTESSRPVGSRWKFSGPWLAGMTEEGFRDFLSTEPSIKGKEFMDFLRDSFQQRRAAEVRNEDIAAGRDIRENYQTTDEEFQEHLRGLRNDLRHAPAGELAQAIEQFFDLPRDSSSESSRRRHSVEFAMATMAADKAPPSTHPSAGISYLKTASVLHNHPLFGPQATSPPIESRVLAQTHNKSGFNRKGRIGVAGFTANYPESGAKTRQVVGKPPSFVLSTLPTVERTDWGGNRIGVTIPGGARVWTEPLRAAIDSRGRTIVEVKDANQWSIAVHTKQHMPQSEPQEKPSYNTRKEVRGLVDGEGPLHANSTVDTHSIMSSIQQNLQPSRR